MASGDADVLRAAHLAERHRDGQDAILVAGFDVVSIHRFGEGDGSLEGTGANLLHLAYL